MGWCCGAGKTDTNDVQLQINQLSDGIFSKKHAVCSKSGEFASILANPDHFKDIVVKKRFSPPLQVNHVRIFKKKDQIMKEIH